MGEWTVPEPQVAWMIATGFARRLDDGSVEMTAKGAEFTMGYLQRQDPGAAPRKDKTDG